MGTLIYEIAEIPDRTYPRYSVMAQGDVVKAAGEDFERLLRSLAGLPPGAASISVRFKFDPEPAGGGIQSRLAIYLIAQCWDSKVEGSIRLLLVQGALRRFYRAKAIAHFEAPWAILQAACDIVRREDAFPPLHTREFNDRIPNNYYTITSFKGNDQNDYLLLDSVLSETGESVLIDICVEPTDISHEIQEHTGYLSQLQSVNRKWDLDEEDGLLDAIECLDNNKEQLQTRTRELKPLRYTDPLADDILRHQQRFHETLREPHLLFHLRVLAQSREVAHLVGSVIAGIAFENGTYRLRFCGHGEKAFDEAVGSVRESRVSVFPGSGKLYEAEDKKLYSGLSRLTQLATVQELGGAFKLPVASLISPRCIRKNTDPPIKEKSEIFVCGEDLEVPGSWLGPDYVDLAKGLAVFGVPGFGKTTAGANLILQNHERGIPFLLIETAKTEYRILKTLQEDPDRAAQKLAKALEIYTPGNEHVSPYRYSPLELLPGIHPDERIGDLLSCFYGSMPLEGPLQALLGEALERVYEEHPSRDRPPLITDLLDAANHVLDEKGYSQDTASDIRSALEVRLGSLTRLGIGKVLQCRRSIPSIEHLFKVPAVIELDCLPPEQACLLTLFLLSSIREHLKTAPKPSMVPRYMIIIEEAHNIVGRDTNAAPSPDVADPKVFSAEAVSRALTEFRGLGVSLVIIDQSPSKIAPEVIKATTTKLAFRLVHEEDREVLGPSLLFEKLEFEEIARLLPGEAFLFTEGFYKPRRIWTVNLHERFRLK